MIKKVKYISIDGKIQIPDEISHEEFLNMLHRFLKNEGRNFHFSGTTKEEGTDSNDNSRRKNEAT